MRSRLAILAAAMLLVFMIVPQAIAASHGVFLAQSDQSDSDTQGEGTGEDDGQSDPEAETTTKEGETAEAEPEAGPPWTFQMARIIVVLSILLGLAIFRWYWKLVGSRQRVS